jgi:sec-independent protein translocase protein TatA
MGSFSVWHWIIVLIAALLLFGGRGKISSVMGDFASGIKAFKKGMSEEDVAKNDAANEPKTKDAKVIDHRPADMVKRADTETKVEGTLE